MIRALKTKLEVLGGLLYGEDPLSLGEGQATDLHHVQETRQWMGPTAGTVYSPGNATKPANAPNFPIVAIAPKFTNQVFDYLMAATLTGGVFKVTEAGGYVATVGFPNFSASWPVSTASYLDDLWFASPGDFVAHYNGTNWVTPAALAAVTAVQVSTFFAHVVLCGTVETGVACPQRVRWSVVGDPDDWAGTTSGFVDLVDTPGRTMCAFTLLDRMIVLKEDAIYEGVYVGGEDTFRFSLINASVGVTGPCAAKVFNNTLYFLGSSDVYSYSGGEVTSIGAGINNLLLSTIVASAKIRAYLDASLVDDCLYLLLARTGTTHKDLWRFDPSTEAWWHVSIPEGAQCLTCTPESTFISWSDMDNVWATYEDTWNSASWATTYDRIFLGGPNAVERLAKSVSTNLGVVTPSFWISPEFAWDWFQRIIEFNCDAWGAGSVGLCYSVDQANSWVDCGTQTTGSELEAQRLKWTFDVNTESIMFKIYWPDSPTLIRRLNYRVQPRKGDR